MDSDRKYRIAMVAACPFPSLRGSQALIRELSEALAAKGHDVHVVTYPSAQHMAPVERMSIHRVPRIPLVSSTPTAMGWQKWILDLLLVWVLWRVTRRHRVDVIHAHNIEAPFVSYIVRMLTGVPVVYHAHNALADELPYYFDRGWAQRLAHWVGGRIDDRVAAWSDCNIALSSRLGAYLAVRGAASKTVVIPPAILPSALRAAPGRVDGPGGAARIAYAGNLDRYQNVECLLEAFERVCAAEPRSRLFLLLHPATSRRIKQRMAELSTRSGVSVRVVRTYAAIGKELRKADVLVCPRTSWSGFPIKILNYMASGRPIVQARSSAHGLSEGVNSLLFDDDDPGALAKAILRILRDPELADRLGSSSRELAGRRYVWSAVLPEIEAVYRALIGDDKDSGRGKKSKTLVGRLDRMTEMRKTETRQLASPAPEKRRLAPVWVGLACLFFMGCAASQPDMVASLPAISAPMVPGQYSANYKIESGDQLRVKFLYHPELDVKVPVAPDGNILIPGVGEVLAEGKTAEDVAGEVERISSDQLRDPEVTVIVAEFGERVVYVGGEVRLPGPVRFREGMTPLQAILDRGGFTEVARADSVLHLHPNGGTYDATRLDYTTNINEQELEQATLGVYDVVYVPRTFIGDANAFVRLYIRGLLPTMPRVGVGYQLN
jgi:glycosyltransferase involved in cell wall biosynthesis/protein involved in polysaccharide export with SLBB domain